MADFFTRLAERTLGLANTIQPVITPFFAPGAPLLDAGLEAEQTIDVQDRSPQPRSPSQIAPRSEAEPNTERAASPIASRQDRRIVPRSEAARPGEQNPPSEDRAATRAADSDHGPDSDSPIIEQHTEQAQRVQPVPAPQPSQAPRRIDPTAQTPRLVEASTMPTVARPTVRSQPDEPAEDFAPRTLVQVERAEPAQLNRETLLPPIIDRQPAAEQPMIRPEQRTLVANSARAGGLTREQSPLRAHQTTLAHQTNRSPEPPAPPPAPQIHVSIGRIEVRAVTPPPPAPQPAAPPAPRMSLDDYLRSQNGGRR